MTTADTTQTDKLHAKEHSEAYEDDHPEEKGLYPSFPALWHLEVLLGEVAGPGLPAWERAREGVEKRRRRPVRVALIDTPVAYNHPNLVGAIDLGLMRDFTVSNDGHFPEAAVTDEDRESRAGLLDDSETDNNDVARRILGAARAQGFEPPAFGPRNAGAHGTAMAGLIGARPAHVKMLSPAMLGTGDDMARVGTVDLPYVGINPYCRIVPIATTAAPDPAMVLATLTYARMIRADVVVIAESWADDAGREKDKTAWKDVEAALYALARTALVFCAAGNSGRRAVAYPAVLCTGMPSLVAVTACDAAGVLLSYAAEGDGALNIVRTLSTDSPTLDRISAWVDPWSRPDPDLAVRRPADVRFLPAQAIIATDVPGPSGYNPSPYQDVPADPEGPWFEIGSLFARFSGTSAATAIAAGLASLALAQRTDEDDHAVEQGLEKVSDTMAAALFDLTAAEAWLKVKA